MATPTVENAVGYRDRKDFDALSSERQLKTLCVHPASRPFGPALRALRDAPPGDREARKRILNSVFQQPARIPLPPLPPGVSAWDTLTPDMETAVENLAPAFLNQPHWPARAAWLDRRLLQKSHVAADLPPPVALAAWTAQLECLAETEIACLQAATAYAVSAHAGWRAAAVEWLQPHAATWLKDWLTVRPLYCRFATQVRALHPDVPAWLVHP